MKKFKDQFKMRSRKNPQYYAEFKENLENFQFYGFEAILIIFIII